MQFEVHGPYRIPRYKGLVQGESHELGEFWREIEADHPLLGSAHGCYILAIGAKPWYVGKAEKLSFERECLNHRNQNRLNRLMRDRQGHPVLYLLPQLTKSGIAYSTQTTSRPIQAVEKMLIQLALHRNPELLNIKDTRLFKNLNVPGVLNTKRGQARSASVQHLKRVLGI